MATKSAKDMPDIDPTNAVWIMKMRTLFRHMDVIGNGHLLVDDFIEIATTLMNVFPKMSSNKGDQLVTAMVNLWFGYLTDCVQEHHRVQHQLNETEFIQNIAKHINSGLKEHFVSLLCDPLFHAADNDNDDKITCLEYKSAMKSFKVNERESDIIFKSQDKDRDGKITREEFEAAMADYFYNCDLKTSIKMFGSYVGYKRPEDYGEVECGPIWEGKMRLLFRRLDVTENQYLSCQDFIKIARNISSRSHLTKAKSDAVMRQFLNIWIKYICIDKEGRHFASINEKDFIKNMRSLINSDFRHEIDAFGVTFFKAVEMETEGHVTLKEYRSLQEAWNVPREEAENMFKVIDSDKDGRISRDEYLHGWVEFFLSEDRNSIYKAFFGTITITHERR